MAVLRVYEGMEAYNDHRTPTGDITMGIIDCCFSSNVHAENNRWLLIDRDSVNQRTRVPSESSKVVIVVEGVGWVVIRWSTSIASSQFIHLQDMVNGGTVKLASSIRVIANHRRPVNL